MKERLELIEAYQEFDQYIQAKKEVETVSLEDAFYRILAQDIYATIDQPPFHKSAVDGYAFHFNESKDASKDAPLQLEVIETIYAGHVGTKEVKEGQAVQIMTGASVPDSCDCVIRLEDTNDDMHHLEIYKSCQHFDNICQKGEDFKEGNLLLKKGTKLDYICLGVLSSIGLKEVDVYQPIRIVLCTTGDEIVMPGNDLPDGKIYDSNYILLSARLKELGYPISKHIHIQDDAKNCGELLEKLSHEYDLILSTGAVSVGKKDILHDALEYAGAKKIFWRVKLKPGTPAIFSMLNGTPIVSLSGNPFAASCTFEVLARYALSIVAQDESLKIEPTQATILCDFRKKSPQRRFIRAIYKDGHVSIPTGMHSSNELGSMIGCNALIDVEAGNQGIEKGSLVRVWKL